MDHRIVNSVKNIAIGAAVGAVALAAGTAYMNDGSRKAVKDMKKAGRKIARAGEAYVRDMID